MGYWKTLGCCLINIPLGVGTLILALCGYVEFVRKDGHLKLELRS